MYYYYYYYYYFDIDISNAFLIVTLLTVEHLKDTYPVQLEWRDSTSLKINE